MASMDIQAIRTVSGNQPLVARRGEKAAQTYILGVPLMVDQAVGFVQEWDGTTILRGIAGVSQEPARNLTTSGVGVAPGEGGVPNQPLARKIYHAPGSLDGRVGMYSANDDTIFRGQVGPAQTTAVTDPTKQYGMTKDSDGHWFVDKTKTTIGTNTVVTVSKLDPVDTVRGVHFTFTKDAQQNLN